MKIALTPDQLKFLKDNVVKPLQQLNTEVYIFGSRATGQNQEFSDVDLMLRTDEVNQEFRQKIGEINELLINSSFPYKVDLVIECDIADSYLENIQNQLVQLKKG